MKQSLLFLSLFVSTLIACDQVEPPVYGCSDELAINYNPTANIDDESCIILGCQDTEAFNYNPEANVACDTLNPSNSCCCYSTFNCFEDPSTIVRKVLIEDFTGHKCQNCPEAAEELHHLQEEHGAQIVGIAIHAGYFAEPNPDDAPHLTTDFRIEEGNTIHDFFGPQSYPIGMVNRTGYPNNHLKSYNDWGAIASSVLEQMPALGICINESCETISISLLGLENKSNNHQMVVSIIEDHVIDWQTVEGQGNVVDYEHNHVLRKTITGAWGESIGAIVEGELSTHTFTYTLEESWVKGNCQLVAYVYDEITKEVLQVEALPLTE